MCRSGSRPFRLEGFSPAAFSGSAAAMRIAAPLRSVSLDERGADSV